MLRLKVRGVGIWDAGASVSVQDHKPGISHGHFSVGPCVFVAGSNTSRCTLGCAAILAEEALQGNKQGIVCPRSTQSNETETRNPILKINTFESTRVSSPASAAEPYR